MKVAGGTRVSSRGSLLCWSSVVRPTGLLGLVWSASAAGGRWELRRAELLLHAGRRELRSHGAFSLCSRLGTRAFLVGSP